MTRLGVEISKHKTHVSRNTYEFAKRWIQKRVEISPLPLKGICHNKRNLHIVFLQLYSYLKRCNTAYKYTCLELISEIMSNVPLGKKVYYKPSTIIRRCYDFNMVIRYAFNDATPYELYSYLCSKVKGVYPIPCEKLIPSFVRELLTLGLFHQAEMAGDEIKGYFDSFYNRFKEGYKFKPEILKHHPLLHACYNRLEEIHKDLYRLRASKDFNLIEAMQAMRVDKIDEIVALKRDTKKTVKSLDTLWRSSLKHLNKISELNYNSYEISGFSYGMDLQP